jgi:hypothetical protein
LFPRVAEIPRKPRKAGVSVTATDKTMTQAKGFPTTAAAVADCEKRLGKRSASWTYHDAGGQPVAMVARWDRADGKEFRPFAKIDGGWRMGSPGGPWPLYQLPALLQSQCRVHVCDGEKAADAVRSIGLTATTSAQGANSAKRTDWTPVAGRQVVILPDHDEAGGKYGEEVIALLDKVTPRPIVRMVHLPGLPAHGDAVEYIAARRAAGLDDAAIRAEIESLANNAEVVSDEPPEPGIAAYQPFPLHLLPEPIRGYVTASAAAIGCDPVFIGLPILAAVASAIGNSRRIALKRRWTEPAIIWALTIATSGGHKSPGFDAAILPIRKRQAKAKHRYDEALKAYETQVEDHKQKLADWKEAGGGGPRPEQPAKPTWERCWTDDTTIEALASLLLHNPRGLLLPCDELSAWFGSFDRYAKAGTKTSADAARWLHIHGGRELFNDRKTGEPRTIFVPHATVSVAGGIQPGVLRRTLSREHQENGMAARFLFAMPPKRRKRWSEAEIDEKLEADVLALFERLFDLHPDQNEEGELVPRLVKLSTAAKHDVWIPFYNLHGKEQVELDDDLSATWSKLEGYAARLALVHHLIRVAANGPTASNPATVDEVSMAAGIALSRWFGQEAKRVYGMLAEDETDQGARALMERVERLGGIITAYELKRHARQFRNTEQAEAALQGLVNRGLGAWTPYSSTVRGGRPTRAFVLRSAAVNPAKHEKDGGFSNSSSDGKEQADWGEV